jgi:4-alpha-glucanotransferase
MQDYLTLGAESRMNFPGTMTDANWTWRAEEGFADAHLCKRIRAMTKLYGRLAPEPKVEEAEPEEAPEVSEAEAEEA